MADKSKLGLLSICLLGVNAIVGTGIFLLFVLPKRAGFLKRTAAPTFTQKRHSVNLSALKSVL